MEQRIVPPGKLKLGFAEIWHYRELFYFFTWRDIKVKYKQTVLGFAWAVLQPFLMMVVFSIFFGKALKVPSDGIPYPIFAYSGLLFWNLFSTGLSGAGNAMVSQANIIKKIYFPRLIIPISSLLVASFDFLMALVVYIGLVIWYGFPMHWLFWGILPVSLILTLIASLGPGLLVSALNVKYRDFRYVLPFAIQLGLFVTPVIYPISMISKSWLQNILALNPMYAPITLARYGLTEKPFNADQLWLSVGMSLILFVVGLLYFRKTEAFFADVA